MAKNKDQEQEQARQAEREVKNSSGTATTQDLDKQSNQPAPGDNKEELVSDGSDDSDRPLFEALDAETKAMKVPHGAVVFHGGALVYVPGVTVRDGKIHAIR